MGVHNTSFPRITAYLKQNHIDFLDKLASKLSVEGQTTPSRSDILRAILDDFIGMKDWNSNALYQEILKIKLDLNKEG